MPLTTYDLTQSWSATNRYGPATGTPSVKINNRNAIFPMHWTVTTDANAPTAAVQMASVIPANETDRLQMNAGEYLWMAFSGGASPPTIPASIEVVT